jgi:hypothetical protein
MSQSTTNELEQNTHKADHRERERESFTLSTGNIFWFIPCLNYMMECKDRGLVADGPGMGELGAMPHDALKTKHATNLD